MQILSLRLWKSCVIAGFIAPTPSPPPYIVHRRPRALYSSAAGFRCSKLALRSLEGALLAIRSGVAASSPSDEVLRCMGEVFRLKDAAALLAQVCGPALGLDGDKGV